MVKKKEKKATPAVEKPKDEPKKEDPKATKGKSYACKKDFSHQNGNGQIFDYKKGHKVAHSDLVNKHPYGEIIVKGLLKDGFID